MSLLFNPDEEKKHLSLSRTGLQGAANSFQLKIIKGMEQNLAGADSMAVLNTLTAGVFPGNYRKLLIRPGEWKFRGLRVVDVGYVNLHLVKQALRYLFFTHKIMRWAVSSKTPKHVIAYSLYPVFVYSLMTVKIFRPRVGVTYIVGDLPSEFGIQPENRLKSFVRAQFGGMVLRNLRHADSFVFLTEAMKGPVKAGGRPYAVMEGLVDGDELNGTGAASPGKKNSVLYAGSLSREYGILNLLDAFELIKERGCELWIAGSGDEERTISLRAKKNKAIKFFGYLAQSAVRKLQQEAGVLVNPRQNRGNYTRYSFPSKTLEYLASGRPVVMYRLDGVPPEYEEHVFLVDGEGPAALGGRIAEVLGMPGDELALRGRKAREWVLREKGLKKQSKKILDLAAGGPRRENSPG